MNTNVSIHHVKKVVVEVKKQESSNGHKYETLTLWIYDNDNKICSTSDVTIFSHGERLYVEYKDGNK